MKNNFLETIYQLRTIEHLILYDEIVKIEQREYIEVIEFLEDEFKKEALEYPFQVPEFDHEAALLGAKITYYAAQLLLNRSNTLKEIKKYWKKQSDKINPSKMLSADLCLRFLPQIYLKMQAIDPDDLVLELLKNELNKFYYSAIGYGIVQVEDIDFEFDNNDCLNQLITNRVVSKKDIYFAKNPTIQNRIKSNLGDYKTKFWKDL